MTAGPVNTLKITVQRKFAAGWPIVVEYSRADALSPIRSDGVLKFGDKSVEELKSLLEQPREYGVRLGIALFDGEDQDGRKRVRDAFVGARQESDRLRVLLCIEADDLRDLRWERLAAPIDGGDWDVLVLNQRTPFSLHIPSNTDRRFPPIGRRDLRALLLVASPKDSDVYNLKLFNVPDTVAGVRSALGEIPCDVLANIDGAIGPPSLDALCARLTDRSGRYTLLHVVCHGKVIEAGAETVVYWANADNLTEKVTAIALVERLSRFDRLPYFAFLAACESASAQAEAALGGLAQSVVRKLGMPAVLAMTEKVTMQTAAALATAFYRQLAESGEVDTALPEATAELARRGDILVPALFSRLGNTPLFRVPSDPGSPNGNPALDTAVIRKAEQELAKYMGPIAATLVRKAAKEVATPQELYSLLATKIKKVDEQTHFLRKVTEPGDTRDTSVVISAQPAGTFDPSLLAIACEELMKYLGPIAKRKVDKAARGATTHEDFYRRLADHLHSDGERTAFLKLMIPR